MQSKDFNLKSETYPFLLCICKEEGYNPLFFFCLRLRKYSCCCLQIREHHRKVRKEAKKRGHKKPKKDPGVPSAAPFKEELLREAEQRKQRVKYSLW